MVCRSFSVDPFLSACCEIISELFGERVHRGSLRFAHALDVNGLRDADVAMAQDGLYLAVLNSKRVQGCCKAAAESVPAVPLRECGAVRDPELRGKGAHPKRPSANSSGSSNTSNQAANKRTAVHGAYSNRASAGVGQRGTCRRENAGAASPSWSCEQPPSDCANFDKGFKTGQQVFWPVPPIF